MLSQVAGGSSRAWWSPSSSPRLLTPQRLGARGDGPRSFSGLVIVSPTCALDALIQRRDSMTTTARPCSGRTPTIGLLLCSRAWLSPARWPTSTASPSPAPLRGALDGFLISSLGSTPSRCSFTICGSARSSYGGSRRPSRSASGSLSALEDFGAWAIVGQPLRWIDGVSRLICFASPWRPSLMFSDRSPPPARWIRRATSSVRTCSTRRAKQSERPPDRKSARRRLPWRTYALRRRSSSSRSRASLPHYSRSSSPPSRG